MSMKLVLLKKVDQGLYSLETPTSGHRTYGSQDISVKWFRIEVLNEHDCTIDDKAASISHKVVLYSASNAV